MPVNIRKKKNCTKKLGVFPSRFAPKNIIDTTAVKINPIQISLKLPTRKAFAGESLGTASDKDLKLKNR